MSIMTKTALVTGGSSGIGEATALEFAKLGINVAITGRNTERIDKVIKSLIEASPNKAEGNFLGIQADFEKQGDVEPIVGKVVQHFGRLDIVVNNAGYSGRALSFYHPDFYQDFQNIMQVNLMAATRIAQLSIPHLEKTKGVLVNVSSIVDRIAFSNGSYSISKAGLTMLTKTLANALGDKGVRVVGVAPGPIITNFAPEESMRKFSTMTGLNRVGEAKEVADTIVFLCSDKASFIHGSTIDIDGGYFAKLNGYVGTAKIE